MIKELDYYEWKRTVRFRTKGPIVEGALLRLGQAFLNHFLAGYPDSVLFYCEDPNECERIIFEKYVEKIV